MKRPTQRIFDEKINNSNFFHAWYNTWYEASVKFKWQLQKTIHRWYEVRYSGEISDADPEKIINVPTKQICYTWTLLDSQQVKHAGRVYPGIWDTPIERVEKSDLYKSFHDHFIKSIPWEETTVFQDRLSSIKNGQERFNVTTEKGLRELFEGYDRIYDDMQKNGYKSQKELLEERPESTREANNDALKVEWNEISVCISRGGTMIRHGSGRHRLILAHLLDVDTVPVHVRVRHTKWQRIRDKLRCSDGIPKELHGLQNHPDLTDLIYERNDSGQSIS